MEYTCVAGVHVIATTRSHVHVSVCVYCAIVPVQNTAAENGWHDDPHGCVLPVQSGEGHGAHLPRGPPGGVPAVPSRGGWPARPGVPLVRPPPLRLLPPPWGCVRNCARVMAELCVIAELCVYDGGAV